MGNKNYKNCWLGRHWSCIKKYPY